MKFSNIGMVWCFLLALITGVARGQDTVKTTINAVVRGQYGEPVIGARVTNESSGTGTKTNETGAFSIKAPSNSRLTVTAQGYAPALVSVSDTLKQIALIKEDLIVPVAYRKAVEDDLLGGVSSVNFKSIFEKNFSTSGFDGLEAFAAGFNGTIWGMNGYLVLIDGVPRNIDNIMPSEIDQITVLKSAAAVALYGSRGAKGVVLVTTKRGNGNGQQIKVRGNAGINVPKSYPKYLGSAEYMTLYNEAYANDGLNVNGPAFTQENIFNSASGTNPYRYPNVNYYSSEYLKRSFNRYDITTEISGGNERARYYTNVGFWSAGSLIDFGSAKGNTSDRVNVRGNVDMQLTSFLKAHIDASAVFNSSRGVNADYWASAATLRPNRFTPLVPLSYIESTDAPSQIIANGSSNIIDGKYLLGGTQLDQTNPFAAIYAGGSNKSIRRQFQFTTGIDADLNRVLKGLTFSTNLGIDYYLNYTQGYNNGYATYSPNWTTYNGKDVINTLTQYGSDTKNGVQNISNSQYRQTVSFWGQFNYNNTIADKHNLSAVLVGAAYRQAESAVYQSVTNSNTGLQLGYNYKKKYYADFTGAMVYSPKFLDDKAYRFSPTASLGWRLSEESFLKGSKFVDNLKLTASAGIIYTDIDVTDPTGDYFLYQSVYTPQGSYYTWNDGTNSQSFDSRRGTNNALTFGKRREISLGLQGAFFKNTLSVSANVFRNQMDGIAVQNGNAYPNYFSVFNSSFIPYVNLNNDQRTGFDINVNLHKRSGDVDWIIGATALYYTTKATKRVEVFADQYQNRQGRPLDAIFGLQNDGFYMSATEATAANNRAGAAQPAFGNVKQGDIKYKDINGDGYVNNQDEVYLGRSGALGSPLTLGLNLTTRWKNFTFFALATGRYGAKGIKNNQYFWVDGQDKYSDVVRNRWTEATKNTATFPRLTTLTSDNNFRTSDFWLFSADRFDLSKVQISYDLPEGSLKGKFFRSLGMYVTGFNLLTVAKEREILEMNIGSAPQTRFYNVGVKAGF
jgi:TonB-linked SusC/RagA family outer membrane protein